MDSGVLSVRFMVRYPIRRRGRVLESSHAARFAQCAWLVRGALRRCSESVA